MRVIVPSIKNHMANLLEDIYCTNGQFGVHEYVMENHPDWEWDYCEPCESRSPVFVCVGVNICAACFTVFEEE